MKSRHLHIVACSGLVLIAFTGAAYFSTRTSKVIQLTDERELKVNLQAGFGNLTLSRGDRSNVVWMEMDKSDVNDMADCYEYSIRDRVGYLNISTDCKPDDEDGHHHGSHSVHIDRLDSRNWSVQFTDAVPIAFDIELGLGKGDIDMTGLAIKDFSLSCGASSVYLRFSKPNKEIIEDMNIEAGVSKFEAQGLCNAHFQHLKFDGGVGSYALDFSGLLDREVDADIEVGLGTLTITIPDRIGAKVYYEKTWIAHLSIDNDFSESSRDENTYLSSNYSSAKGKINLHIDAGLGSVKVRRTGD